MKIIDILNKMANGEEVPEKIKYDHQTYFYDEECNDYMDYDDRYGLFGDKFLNGYGLVAYLNDEVEIVEYNKKIKYITSFYDGMSPMEKELKDKVNELIDEVNKCTK